MLFAGSILLGVLISPVWAALPCGTPLFFGVFLRADTTPIPPRPPGPTKGIRDAMAGECNGQETSENFVLKWGNDAPPSDDEVAQIMEALETSWHHELNVMDHARPYLSLIHI